MVELAKTFSQFKGGKILVVGDLLLDTYTIGNARRISPEAPVPVVHVKREEHRPGGSGNVALNLVSMGLDVAVLGRIGQDEAGELLRNGLEQEGIETTYLVTQQGYPTPVKNRIIAENQQIARIDHEEVAFIPEMLEQQVIESLPELMSGIDVAAVSDYGKGFLSETLLSPLIDLAKEKGILTIVDPKGTDFSKYRGADLIKPNLTEAYAAANMPSEAPIDHIAEILLEMVQCKALMITRSSDGISLYFPDQPPQHFPAKVHEVKDVTGAGDTVLAMAACALTNKLSYCEAAQLSNIAAGIAIEKLGCARVSLTDIARKMVKQAKIVKEEHIPALQHALKGKPYTILEVDSIDAQTYKVIQQIRNEKDLDVIIYVNEEHASPPFLEMISSIKEVQFITTSSACVKILERSAVKSHVNLREKLNEF